jgi:aminoacylase
MRKNSIEMTAAAQSVPVQKLSEYLQIRTDHPAPDYASATAFLKAYAAEIGVDVCKEIQLTPDRSVVLMTYLGTSPDKPSILLNSHTDVVPADWDKWTCNPFEGKVDENGDVYGRGVQDMKSVSIQHLEVIRRMKANNVRPERSIHLSFVPDEELGGLTGMMLFIQSDEMKALNVGLALDEGQPSPDNQFIVYYGERLHWTWTVTCRGNTGHGSRFIEKTAAEKMQRLINVVLAYREGQKEKLKKCSCSHLGDVNTINLSMIHGGLAMNMVVPEINITFDIRISPTTDLNEFDQLFKSWVAYAEGDDGDSGSIVYTFREDKVDEFALTSTDEKENPWWKCFSDSMKRQGHSVRTEIFPAATDSRYLREVGCPAFGFTPMNNTVVRLHDHDERVNADVFVEGISVLYNVLLDLANMP